MRGYFAVADSHVQACETSFARAARDCIVETAKLAGEIMMAASDV